MTSPTHEPTIPTPADDGPTGWDDDSEIGEEEIPRIVLYAIAGLLILSFTLYIVVGGGHNHFH